MAETHVGNDPKVGLFQIGILLLSLLLLAALGLDTLCHFPVEISNLIQLFDNAVCGLLLADFFARLWRAKDKAAFLKWGWIDLVASIPNWEILRWGRMVRILRIIRLLRALRSIQRILQVLLRNKVETGAVSLGMAAFLLVIFSSISVLLLEQSKDSNIKTAEDAIWWSVTTITTVGYGDRYPVTTEGRMLGIFLMVTGVGMFGGLSGLVASVFLGANTAQTDKSDEILARLTQLEAKIDHDNHQRRGSS